MMITSSEMIRAGSTSVDDKMKLGGLVKESPVAVQKLNDEHSLTSDSTTIALSNDSECSTEPTNDENKIRYHENKTVGKCEDSKVPTLADLSYSMEEEEERLSVEKRARTTHEEDDHDEMSQASESTILSELSSVEEKHDLDRMEDDFILRDELIRKLVLGKDPDHVRIVKEFEDSMRAALRQHFEQLETEESNRRSSKKRPMSAKPSFLQRWNTSLLFSETARGCASIVLYCVAHLSCWEITTAFLYELTQNYENQTAVHIIFLFISLAVLRVSGGIFGWLDTETYNLARSALRRRDDTLDARLIKWFRRYPNLKAMVNLLAFFVCWTAVAYFQNRGLHLLDKRETIAQGLPSFHRQDVYTSVKDKLVYGLSYEEEVLELEAQDYAYLLKEVSPASYSALMGDDYAALVSTQCTILFFGVAAILSISVLRFKLGHTFEI